MSDKVGLITGGARGIGRAIALALAYQGWSIALCYRTSEKEAVKIVNEIEQKGSRGLRVRCDVSDPEAAQAFVKHVERKWGRIINFSMANADQLVAQPEITAHYIAKAGILILTRSLARVLAPYGITVNSISPGFIRSGSKNTRK